MVHGFDEKKNRVEVATAEELKGLSDIVKEKYEEFQMLKMDLDKKEEEMEHGMQMVKDAIASCQQGTVEAEQRLTTQINEIVTAMQSVKNEIDQLKIKVQQLETK